MTRSEFREEVNRRAFEAGAVSYTDHCCIVFDLKQELRDRGESVTIDPTEPEPEPMVEYDRPLS